MHTSQLLRGSSRSLLAALALVATTACAPARQAPPGAEEEAADPAVLRIALFNVRELTSEKLARVDPQSRGADEQLRAAAEIVRRIDPDVLVLQEIDLPETGPLEAARLEVNAVRFRDAWLDLPYPHVFVAPSNTGVLTGLDLDRNGIAANEARRGQREHGDDSFGFGLYPGQYAMAVLSRFPIDRGAARTFQRFRWRDLPGNHLPTEFYSEEAVEILRLSSKSHWDLPLRIPAGGGEGGERVVHLLVSHPTPPVFDGDEDRNGRRNFDEIGFWAAYLDGEPSLYDDQGRTGGLDPGASFVIAGDLNARPDDEPLYRVRSGEPTTAIGQLLERDDVQDPGAVLSSRGALAGREPGPPAHKERSTAEFLDGARVDYLLPSRDLEVVDGGVFWPSPEESAEGARLAELASDHRLVWLDLRIP
ncbi:MAG TPA: endonuclease/exonuclease/phosphatase family protein [Thermoanaerobaculia bacterium]|nr:endonuclease/exonuclease/phosphatase family protein [Thermoanaerobaculia bacterium]